MLCCRCKKEKSEFDGKKSCIDCRTKRVLYNKKRANKLLSIPIPSGCKRCNRCKVIKNQNEFVDDNEKCIDCQFYCDSYYKNNKDQEIARSIQSQANKGRDKINAYKRELNRKNPINYVLQSAKSRAKKKNIPFDLTREDIVIPERCPILGYELHIASGKSSSNSISIDRIDPTKGYVKGNIHIISWRANDIKGNATLDELKKLVAYLEAKNSSA